MQIKRSHKNYTESVLKIFQNVWVTYAMLNPLLQNVSRGSNTF